MQGRDRSPDRFNMRNRSNVVNGQNYGDYPRDYHQRNAMPVMPFGPPYERSVDDFLRRTARMPNRVDNRRYRDRR
ncbi:hypothetical protein HNY73_000637 [Argiope bruennichi]|uniref:Uncharacterized protein n=1 Tax=Argiope bruennichi TaxID=94029 RepID=A0A8T0G2G6_ARGBR|nr:hypothetical protein HNY73_000637 [Argiope bruennichi]